MRILLILLLATQLNAQQDAIVTAPEFYKYRIETKARFENIELNLQKCHKQHSVGVVLVITGLVANALATPLIYNGSDAGIILLSAGGVLSFSGMVTIWNSHKYIGRAGKR